MPYSKRKYGTKAQYKKYKSCVTKVKAKDKRVKSPHAICRTAIYGKKKNPKRDLVKIKYLHPYTKKMTWVITERERMVNTKEFLRVMGAKKIKSTSIKGF